MGNRLLPLLGCLLCVVGRAENLPRDWWQAAEAPRAAVPCERRLEASVAFDGSLEEWRQRPALPLGLLHQSGYNPEWHGRSDLSGAVWLAYSAASVIVAAEASDDRLITNAGDRFRGDRLELYLSAKPDADPVTARAVAILPPVPQGGGEIAAAVMDADRREEIPGAVVTWHNVDGGWRVEARIPWSALPGGFPMLDDRRGLALRLVDWDAGDREHAVLSWPATLRPPPAPPGAPGPVGYDAPRLPNPWRPPLCGEMRLTGELSAAEAEGYLPAFVPIGVDRSYYDGDEEARVVALAGLGLSTAARLRVYAVDEQGTVSPLRRGDDWGEGAVAGASWTWNTPWDYAGTTLVVSSLEEPDVATVRAYSFIESVGKAYKEHLERLKKLRDRMLAAAVTPGSDTRRRRYIGSVLINLEEKESGQAAWRNYVVRADVDQLKRDLDDLQAQFERAVSGQDPYAGRKGTYLRGYVSDIDDTLQHYSVAIPDAWAPGKAMPLIVNIHGYGFGQFLGHPAPGFGDAVSVACFGRGNGDYKLWCERDIITVMDAMAEDYGVDPNRVYITGGSMGGTGSWQLATLYPDRFAAIAPTCGNANHRVWEEVWGWGQVGRTYITPYREWLQNTTSAFTYAENLRHVGSYAVHGTLDNIVPVGHVRTMTDRLKNLGYDVVYEEQPGVGHGGFSAGTWERQKSYLMARSRDPWPKRVTFRTSWHRYPGAYWVRLERFREQARDARIDADIRGQAIRVQTTNLKRFSLLLNEHLVDPAQPIKVTVDDLPAYEGKLPDGGVLRLGLGGLRWSPCEAPATLEKNAAVGGPVEHVFMQRFLVVQGTTGDRLTNEVNRLMTEQLAEKWRRWGRGQRARVKLDYDVTDQDIADSNLVCFGGPDSNLIVQRAGHKLPVRIEDGKVWVGQESFGGEDVGIKLCYPNPLSPEHYLCIFAGLTWKGTWDINGRFGNFFDWGIYDDRNYFDFAVFDARTQTPETFLVSGYFDEDWGLAEARIIRGDERLRAVSQPRRPPDPLAPVPAGDEVWLSDLCPKRIDMEKGVVAYDSSFGGRLITLNGMSFDRGIGIHPQAELTYDIDRQFQGFEAWVGVDLEGAKSVSKAREEAERVAFVVYGDGRLLADTGEMRWNTKPRHLVVNLSGVKELRLVARALDGRKWLFGDSSWGLCRLTRPRQAQAPRPREPAGADRLSLAGEWALDDLEVGAGVASGAEKEGAELAAQRRISLPGTIPVALMRAGELPDLYRNDNLGRAAALAEREWWLYRRFDLPSAWQGRKLRLELTGVCQSGEAWLNDTYVGKVAGPFALGELDISAAARVGGSNLLALRILSGDAPWTAVRGFHSPPRENVVGYGVGYGLDGGAAALPLGVTGDVAVRAVGAVRLAPLRVAAQPGEGRAAPTAEAKVPATVTIETVVSNDDKAPADVTLRGAVVPAEGGEEIPFARSLRVEPGEAAPLRVVVEAPAMRLWWPGGVGPRALYRAVLEARVGEAAADSAQAEFGVRSVNIPAEGAQAALVVNGTPLTLRIAEWRPVDRLLQRSRERTEQLLRLAAGNGFNAIRVWAGGGLADPDFYALCDQLGLLVIQDLPLLGDIARPPLDELLAAVDGVVTQSRSHACLVAYISGVDVPDSGPANARLAAVAERLGQLAPDAYAISAVSSQAGPATWEWVDNRTASAHERHAALLKLYQVSLPDAPPADLGFLERDALPAEMSVAPWPLTSWWEAHGGRPATLDAAQAWLGPVRSEDALLDLLRLWQAENARRQAAEAAGGAVMVSCLNESWPRVGGALVDYGLQPRPAADVLRRFLAGPVVFARADRQEVSHGEAVRLDLMGVFGSGQDWWQAKPVSWKELHCRVQGLDGHVWAEQTLPLADGLDGLQQVGTLTWEVGDEVPAGAYLAVTEAPGTGLASDVVPLGVRAGRAPGRVRVLWLAGVGLRLAGVGGIGRERLPDLTPEQVDAVYLGPGDVPPPTVAETAAILNLVRSGAGLLLDGPPAWLAGTGLTELLPARPALGPSDEPLDPARPEILVRSHPAFLGLSGDLPAGLSDGYYEAAEGAEVLARFGPSRPLLMEGRCGQGRVIWWCTPRDYRRRLQVWDGLDRFVLGLLAYAGRLPFGDVQALLQQPAEAPLAALASLPAAALAVSLTTSPVAASPGHPEAREVTVRNDGATPVLLGTLRLVDLPRGATAGFSAGSFTLLPGQIARSILTIRYERRGQIQGKARLLVGGWGAASVSVDLPLELGTPS